MALDIFINHQVKLNYEHLCDLQFLLGLACILPLLESLHVSSSFPKGKMCLFVTLWQLSRSIKLLFSKCSVIKAPIFLQIVFGLSNLSLNASMKIFECSGYQMLTLEFATWHLRYLTSTFGL